MTIFSYGQQRNITGTVTFSQNENTIPGVTVMIKGTTTGTITDVNGKYSIQVSENSKTLVFSFIGMKTIEKLIGNLSIINVQMNEENVDLDEVVIIGYGAVKKSDLTGSVASIKMEDLKTVPTNSFDQGIQGRVSGVNVTQLSAQPGGATSIRIRGGNSIMAGNEPLYVIDGMIVESQKSLSWIGSPAQNDLSSINPSDIESIEILKDASATAIYGARGANGVVLITTKKGKSGQNNIIFEAYLGIQKKANSIEVMNATQFAKLYDEAGFNDDPENYVPKYPDPASLGEGTDWQSEIFRSAPMLNYQLTFSGGNEKTNYSINANYFSQDGIIKGSDFKRYSFRTNIGKTMNKKLKIGTNLTYTYTVSNTVPTDTPGGFFPGVVNTALIFSPILPVYNSDGQYTLTDPNSDAWLDNPVAVTQAVDAVSKINRLLGNMFINYSIIKDLDFRSSFGVDIFHQVQDMYTPRYVYSGSWNNGQARFANSDIQDYLIENTLTYQKTFMKIHKVKILGGFTFQKSNSRSFIDISTGYPNDILGYYGIENASNIPNIFSSFNESAIVSYLGRINYNLKEKYLITTTGRIDGSSKFGKNNRYAFFPSVAFAWRVSEEDFIKNLNVFSNLKLRISYGISGNDRIPNFAYISTMSSMTYYFNNSIPVIGFAPDGPGNNNLKWETTQQFDIGFDIGFINNRISITTDYYNKNTIDLLYFANLPWSTGFNSYLKNIGNLRNRGFEFAVNTTNCIKDFKWNTNLNFSVNKNKILNLKGKEKYINNDTYKLKIGNWAVIREGEEIGSFYGLVSDGIWQLDEAEEAAIYDCDPGDFKYIDQNKDGEINSEDCKIIGHALPDFTWGLINSFSYRNFSLEIFIQGCHGNKILNSNRFELESGNGLSNASINMLDRWTPENPSNKYARANRNVDYLHMSDRYLEDGSYIRFKTISISYNFPQKVKNFMKLKNVKVYVTAQNLFTITNYSGFDPEVGRFGMDNTRMGYDYGAYPSVRSFVIGIVVNI